MKNMVIGLLASLLLSGPVLANDPYLVIDYSKVDSRQYCVFEGKIYTRGIRIKTDTGTYSCRVSDTKQPGQGEATKDLLSWVRETVS